MLRQVYPRSIWHMPRDEKKVYLTFDDGPHPAVTPFILEQLRRVKAKATFFCLGKNVAAHPDLYTQILREGHSTGNHTYNHKNGWKTPDREYLADIVAAAKVIDSNLFRPPYGRITPFQIRQLADPVLNLHPIMWSILSGDFDPARSPEECVENVVKPLRNGSIIVFHDSEKAMPNVTGALPRVLDFLSEGGYIMEKICI